MSQSYGKQRDTNTVCSCMMPFHPAANAHSKSLDAVGIWVLVAEALKSSNLGHEGRRSLRCR